MKFHEVEYYKKMYDTTNFVILKLTPSLVITRDRVKTVRFEVLS